jgi:hypothetical protein
MNPMSKQELVNSAGNFAGSMMRDGYSNAEIITALMDEGLRQAEAEEIIRQLLKIRADNLRQEAKRASIKTCLLIVAFIFSGTIVNVFSNGMGYILILIALGLGFQGYQSFSKQMKEADLLQYSLGR